MASGDATAIPIKNQAYRVTFPILDADGDLVTGAAGLDSEVSKDAGTFADVTAEATEIATASGMYYLDLTATEMNADTVALIVKTTTTGAKTTPIVLYPAESTDIPVNVTAIGGVVQSATDLKDFADDGYNPATHKVAGVLLTDTCTTNTDMVGTDNAALATTALTNVMWTDAKAGALEDWLNGERLDLILDIIAADTTTDIPALIATAQADLDTITGTDGVTLATAQALYAPNKVVPDAAGVAATPAEVATALTDINLDHLVKISVDTNWATTVHLDSVIGQIADVGTSATFDRTTDALEAIRDRGDAEWATATGFNTVVPDVAGTLATYDPPTNTEMVAAFTEIKGATWAAGTDTLEHIRNKQTDIETNTAEIGTAGAGLTDLGGMSTGMKTEVNDQVADVMKTDTTSEMSQAAPPATPTFEEMFAYIYFMFRNKNVETSTEHAVYDNAGTTKLFKAAMSDTTGTLTKDEFVSGA